MAEQATCPCDFCTGKKKLADNWCPGCAEVQLVLQEVPNG